MRRNLTQIAVASAGDRAFSAFDTSRADKSFNRINDCEALIAGSMVDPGSDMDLDVLGLLRLLIWFGER